MNPIKSLVAKYNHNKCEKAWQKLSNQIKYQNEVIILLNTVKGYDEFFDKLKEAEYVYRIDDNMRDSVFVTVRKRGANPWLKQM